jgi:hypothetical protein
MFGVKARYAGEARASWQFIERSVAFAKGDDVLG